MSQPPAWDGPENDYRGIARREPGPMPSVGVVVPVYNRAAFLERTLAGFVAQTTPAGAFEVVVADDGSDEDIAAVVGRFTGRLRIDLVRQERAGFGAGRARNLGAAATDADLLLFVDADCIPSSELIERHTWWHRRAGNVVVAGTRRGIDSTPYAPDDIAAGSAPLSVAAGPPDEPTGWAPDDWRRLVYRRSRRLQIGDAGYRAGVSSNLSVREDRFDAAGGFDPAFTAWGGEDTELAWRLWNDGAFVVPDTRALVYHQIQDDSDDDRSRRMLQRDLGIALVADRVPHGFYRKTPTPFASVPRVSWVVAAATRQEAERTWREASLATYPDAEYVLHGPGDAVAHLTSLGAANSRVTVVADDGPDGFGQALRAARGELLAILDGRVRVDPGVLARMVGRLDGARRSVAVRIAYRIDGDRYLRLDDLEAVDAGLGRYGLPLFALIRRRELMKDPASLSDPGRAVVAALERGRVELIVTGPIELDSGQPGSPRMPRPRDLSAAGPRELAHAALRRARRVRTSAGDDIALPDTALVQVEYVGFPGRQNLGDDAMLEAFRRLVPWADVGTDQPDPRLLVVGGGTLVNADRYYLTRMMRHEAPTVERAMFGTGVRSPDFWGITEPMDDWFTFLDSTVVAGVRGPSSVEALRKLGYHRDLPILGDVALTLDPPGDVPRAHGRIVVCPVWTSGKLWGGDDSAVFAAFAATIRRLRSAGHDVVALSAFPEDDRWIIDLMRDAGAPDLPYVAGYADLDSAMRLLASADLVIAERLHAAVLAAGCGTPFVAVEYRPKVRDFARSVDQEAATLRTDEMVRLDEVVDTTFAERDRIRPVLTAHVDDLRGRQRQASEILRAVVGPEASAEA